MQATNWHIKWITAMAVASTYAASGGAGVAPAGDPVPAVIHRVTDMPLPPGPPEPIEIRPAVELVFPRAEPRPRSPARILITDELPASKAQPAARRITDSTHPNPLRPLIVRVADPAVMPIPTATSDRETRTQVQSASGSLPTGGIKAPPNPPDELPLPAPPGPAATEPPLASAEVLPVPGGLDPTAPDALLLPGDRPIGDMTTNIAPPAGILPPNAAADRFSLELAAWMPRPWEGTVYFWDAPSLCYRPLRYEDPNLERYGYTHCAVLQPAISAALFAKDTIFLPYDMTVHPHRECIYTLGHYRPGSPVPYRHHWPEWNAKAAAVQGAAVTGLFFVIP